MGKADVRMQWSRRHVLQCVAVYGSVLQQCVAVLASLVYYFLARAHASAHTLSLPLSKYLQGERDTMSESGSERYRKRERDAHTVSLIDVVFVTSLKIVLKLCWKLYPLESCSSLAGTHRDCGQHTVPHVRTISSAPDVRMCLRLRIHGTVSRCVGAGKCRLPHNPHRNA